MNLLPTTRIGWLSLVVMAGLAWCVGLPSASAGIHSVIVTQISKTDVAFLDVGSDSAPGVLYVTPLSTTQASCNATNFCTSPEIFSFTGVSTTMVRATTVTDSTPPSPLSVPSTAILRQNKVIMAVPDEALASGTRFLIPIGDVGAGAFLLIGTPLSQAVGSTGGVFLFGSSVPFTTFSISGPGSAAVIPLPSNSVGTTVVVDVTNGVPSIVQLLVAGKGHDFTMTMILPE